VRSGLTTLLLGLGLAFTALAAVTLQRDPEGLHPARFQPWMASIDLDGDSRIDRLEFRQVAGAGPRFEVYDMNQDEAIDLSELELATRHIDPLWLYFALE